MSVAVAGLSLEGCHGPCPNSPSETAAVGKFPARPSTCWCRMNVHTPTPAKWGHSKTRRTGGRVSQGFIPELNALSDGDKRTPFQTPVAIESTSPAQHGAALFSLEAPTAQTVKLVADFTGWEKNPLDLRAGENGVWQVTVALPPGKYAYRFLVDGEWQDDPQCAECEPNAFGTANAVVEVA